MFYSEPVASTEEGFPVIGCVDEVGNETHLVLHGPEDVPEGYEYTAWLHFDSKETDMDQGTSVTDLLKAERSAIEALLAEREDDLGEMYFKLRHRLIETSGVLGHAIEDLDG
jgi:hypothetical protein